MAGAQRESKFTKAKKTLRLPDLEQSKRAVLNSLAAASSQSSHGHAIDELIGSYCSGVCFHSIGPSSSDIVSSWNRRRILLLRRSTFVWLQCDGFPPLKTTVIHLIEDSAVCKAETVRRPTRRPMRVYAALNSPLAPDV